MHLDSLNVFLAQAPAAPGGQGSPFGLLVPMGLIVVMMYFMMIRPQQQRAKQQAKLLSALKPGDRVVTASGLVGVVLSIKEKAVPPSVSLRSADAKFEVTKASISEILEAAPTTES
jgi:preprotein translocase subunit YajC